MVLFLPLLAKNTKHISKKAMKIKHFTVFLVFDVKDFDIERNRHFDYYILKRANVQIAEGTLIFFHGLNEKKWENIYLGLMNWLKKPKKPSFFSRLHFT